MARLMEPGMRKSFTLFATMVLAGCATNPQDIEPMSRDYRPRLRKRTRFARKASSDLDLHPFQNIPVLTAPQALQRLNARTENRPTSYLLG